MGNAIRTPKKGDIPRARDMRLENQQFLDLEQTDATVRRQLSHQDEDNLVGEIVTVIVGSGAPRYAWKLLYVIDPTSTGNITYEDPLVAGNGDAWGYPLLVELRRELTTDDATYEVGDKVLIHRVTGQDDASHYFCAPKAATAAEANPSGIIVMWGGAVVDIPTGWSLCDGTNDGEGNATPDLSGRFIVGSYADTGVPEGEGGVAGALGEDFDYAAPGETGGMTFHGRTENGHPDHKDHVHPIDYTTDAAAGGAKRSTPVATEVQSTESPDFYEMNLRHGGDSDGLNDWVVGSPVNESHPKNDTDNRPAWYSLALIRKD